MDRVFAETMYLMHKHTTAKATKKEKLEELYGLGNFGLLYPHFLRRCN